MRTKRLLFGALLASATAVGIGIVYQRIGVHRDRRRYPQPGRLVPVGSRLFHVHESGAGAPAVVLESGIGSSSLSWATVQPSISRFARVVSYDRAGLGWSSPSTGQSSLAHTVSDLHDVLRVISFPYPRILVGHSFGGLILRAYAATYPEGIAGVVLVDPVLPSDWTEASQQHLRLLDLGARFSRRGAWLAQFGIVRFALWMLVTGARRLPQWIARVSSSGTGSTTIARLIGEVQKLPPDLWPVIQAHWSEPKGFRALAGYLTSLPASAATVSETPHPLHIPLVILSSATSTPAQRQAWDHLATRHVIASKGGHWIQFDQPDLVVEAIHEIVRCAREMPSELL